MTILAPDALGLLAVEVAALGVHAQDVRRARTYTVDGVAVGEFEVEPERGRQPDWDRFAVDLRAALVDPHRGPAAARRPRDRRYDSFSRPTAARPWPSPGCSSTTRPPTSPPSSRCGPPTASGSWPGSPTCSPPHGVRVDQAYVSTLGHEVVDTFYVTRADGAKLTDPEVIGDLERELVQRLTAVSFRSWCSTRSGNARHNIQQSPAWDSGDHDQHSAHQHQESGAAQDDVRPNGRQDDRPRGRHAA